ncbi:MAG: T9SS type A sorting domain-containing protein, partial [Bacteroidia bacterium]|nr:T9SS type A sorting domain-containing protein [Bacteroidia bacterium]
VNPFFKQKICTQIQNFLSLCRHDRKQTTMKINLLLLFLVLSIGLKAQTFQLTDLQTNVNGTGDAEIDGIAHIQNTSNTPLNMLVKRIANNLTTGHKSFFCWGIYCYAPTTSISPDTLVIPVGQTNTSFKARLRPFDAANPYGYPGNSSVTYRFINIGNDSVEVTFYYTIGSSSIDKNISETYMLSSPYPNPSSEFTRIEYSVPNTASLKIYDFFGRQLRNYPIKNNGSVTVDVSNLSSGIYFYSIEANGKTIATKKLTVSR